MMPLVFAREGDTVTIRRIAGRDDVRQHLAELGFVVDSPDLIVSHMAGNLIVQVKGSRVALDRSMAQKIFYGEGRKNGMKTLKEVPVGSRATVKRIHGEGPLRRRIMDMGITKGTEIFVRKVAPLGDPVELTVRGYELSIRKNEAEAIEVEQ